MAETILKETQLRLVFDMGLNEKGKQVFKFKNYNNVKTTSTPDQLLNAAQALANLQTNILFGAERNDSNMLQG
ncbi:DUF1659 domain-containing protein [Metabacillus sp. GX 13764]|uniref:DUF1659 domain-containing protein n=1 Tax=Metabacillus kandeliae TaxID=2900151 RepID=UPI001E4909D8|nr:DUF1659 domain-containing protein [Metabacillus kandeliae]MCD7036114.1 DUF1659 domain-containing protein [Metabacillus kandeliae]